MQNTLYLPDSGKFIQTWVDCPESVMTPVAAESFGANFRANGRIKVSLSCNAVPKIACAGRSLRKWMLYYYQNNVNEL